MAKRETEIVSTEMQEMGPEQISSLVSQIQQMNFNENDERSKQAIKHFYETQINIVMTEDERMMLLSSLNAMTEFQCLCIGKLLREQEKSIKRHYQDWLDMGADPNRKPLYKTINGYLNYHEKRIRIGKTKAYYCMELYDRYDIDTIIDVGIGNILKISTIKDEEIVETVINYTKENDLSADDIEVLAKAAKAAEKIEDERLRKKAVANLLKAPEPEKIDKEMDKIKTITEKQDLDKKEEQARIIKNYKFDIDLSIPKELHIKAQNNKQRDYINDYIQLNIRAIKNYINRREAED